ncbi:hypothetical protein ACFSKL_15315 [Belliella marina]|uniref:CHRD domain-containing protein n=1 Tax=Belliella marina TaxID=1644146 RepID=A0ABW4VPY0_9BACT
MKKLVLLLLLSPFFFACTDDKDEEYTNNSIEYNLYQSSDYAYEGKLLVRELTSGQLELTVQLEGAKESEAYYFPAHLHFGSYDNPDSPIAYMLNPVDIRDLKSTTVLGLLSNGNSLTFEQFKSFDGHVKVHLAESGPDYEVILSAGNIGGNENAIEAFNREGISVCLPVY